VTISCAADCGKWDDLLMDQDDPEKRIADLEDQPAESRTA